MKPNDLYQSPNALAKYYQRFSVDKRCLLTGHSHQAWPDCSRDAQLNAWDDAAEYVDDKWEKVFAQTDKVRNAFFELMDDDSGYLCFGQNTHELLVRFLSALPFADRPEILTTNGEFYSIQRQLKRLSEEDIIINYVNSNPTVDVIPQLIEKLNHNTAAVLVSSVFFQSGEILKDLAELSIACQENGVILLVDAYHQLNVVPFSVKDLKLEHAYVLAGGYKYCQLGEGVCFLRYPKDCQMRPVVTGWFADFEHLDDLAFDELVYYDQGNNRFAGATFDPVSYYRAAEVFDFFKQQKLTPEILREVSQHQISLLIDRFDALSLNPNVIQRDDNILVKQIAGFLSLKSKNAKQYSAALKSEGVFTDVRGDVLRLGPAPYLSDSQLHEAMDIFEKVIAES